MIQYRRIIIDANSHIKRFYMEKVNLINTIIKIEKEKEILLTYNSIDY